MRIAFFREPTDSSGWRDEIKDCAASKKVNVEFVDYQSIFGSTGGEPYAIWVEGGDGSLNALVSDLVGKRHAQHVSIFYCPDGTGNDFARGNGLFRLTRTELIDLLLSHKPTEIAVGSLQEKPFVNMATFGIFAGVTPEVDPIAKNFLGRMSYYLKGMSTLMDMRAFDCHFAIPGQDPIEEKIYGFFVGNSNFSGGGVQVTPQADPKRADLELIIIPELSLGELVNLGLELQKEDPQIDEFNVIRRRIEEFSFSSKTPIKVSLDGEPETLCEGRVKILDQPIKIYLP